jgi:hypothetical protein
LSTTTTPTDSAVANISTPGQLLSRLQRLSQQAPTRFKAVAGQLATSFQSLAGSATGPPGTGLTQLATQFRKAEQTGQLPSPEGALGAQGGTSPAMGPLRPYRSYLGGGVAGSQSAAMEKAFRSGLDVVDQALQETAASSSDGTTALPP